MSRQYMRTVMAVAVAGAMAASSVAFADSASAAFNSSRLITKTTKSKPIKIVRDKPVFGQSAEDVKEVVGEADNYGSGARIRMGGTVWIDQLNGSTERTFRVENLEDVVYITPLAIERLGVLEGERVPASEFKTSVGNPYYEWETAGWSTSPNPTHRNLVAKRPVSQPSGEQTANNVDEVFAAMEEYQGGRIKMAADISAPRVGGPVRVKYTLTNAKGVGVRIQPEGDDRRLTVAQFQRELDKGTRVSNIVYTYETPGIV